MLSFSLTNRTIVDVRKLSEHGLGGVPVLEVGWAFQGREVRPLETMLLTMTTSVLTLMKKPMEGRGDVSQR